MPGVSLFRSYENNTNQKPNEDYLDTFYIFCTSNNFLSCFYRWRPCFLVYFASVIPSFWILQYEQHFRIVQGRQENSTCGEDEADGILVNVFQCYGIKIKGVVARSVACPLRMQAVPRSTLAFVEHFPSR